MLSKKERLTRTDFNRFFSMGKRFQTATATLIFVPFERFHASAVVSKKVAKTAVSRNKLRRRMYDILRNTARDTKLRGVYILIAKASAPSLPYPVLKDDIIALVGRTRVSR